MLASEQQLQHFHLHCRKLIYVTVVLAGSYFASHFIMGGEKFDSTHPEGYLFGENTDLNFLGTRPVAVGNRTH